MQIIYLKNYAENQESRDGRYRDEVFLPHQLPPAVSISLRAPSQLAKPSLEGQKMGEVLRLYSISHGCPLTLPTKIP